MGKNQFVPRKSIKLNAAAVLKAAEEEAANILETAADQVLQHMMERLEMYEGVVGAPYWAYQIRIALSKTKPVAQRGSSSIEFGFVGRQMSEPTLMAAYAMEYGIGSQSSTVGFNAPLSSKPGQQVWGNYPWAGKHLSKAESEYLLPEGFNQPPAAWWSLSMILMDAPIRQMATAHMHLFQQNLSQYAHIV